MWGEIHQRISNNLDSLEAGDAGLIIIPRGCLKSTLVTRNWVVQQLVKDRSLRVLIGSAKIKNSQGFLGAIQKVFENNQEFIDRYGRLKDNKKWSQDAFNILGSKRSEKESNVTAASIGTDMTSQHYDLIMLDDAINREFSTSHEQRQKVVDFYMDCLDLLEPDGRLVVIGTRWHFEDLYSKLIEEHKKRGKFKFIIDEPTMFNPKYTRRDFKAMMDDPETTFLFKEKFNHGVIKKIYQEKVSKPNGSYEFSCQQMNFPVSDENAPFRLEDIKFVWEYPSSLSVYQAIDPAGSERITKKQDDTAIVTCGIDLNLDLYNIDCWADRTTVSGLFSAVTTECMRYPQTRKIGIERNFNATNELYIKQNFPQIAPKLVGYRAPNTMDKDSKIMALQPYVNNGKFFMVQHQDGQEYTIGDKVVKLYPGQYKLIMQMIDYGSTEHDDCVDAQAAILEFAKKPKMTIPSSPFQYKVRSRKTGY